MDKIEFLRPRLIGARFEGGAVPVEVLRDLAALEEMLIEAAKWRFLLDQPGRQRSPRGFSENVELRLTAVEDGSALLVLTLFSMSLHLPGLSPNLKYFEQARAGIVSAIGAAEQNGRITDYLPEKALNYFDSMGRSLREGEAIEFTTEDHPEPVKLNRETRRRLVLASPGVQELTEEAVVRGSIAEADLEVMTFHVQLLDGRRIKAPLSEQHRDVVIDALRGYPNGARIVLQGIGKYDRQNRLLRFESVEHVTPLDPLDVAARLYDLRKLRDGWLDGLGRAPSEAGLDWLTGIFDQQFPDDIPLPYLYPTPDGGVQAEWSLPPHEISLEIDLESHRGEWHHLNLETDEEDAHPVALDEPAEWARLSETLRRLPGGSV